jgi:hypothetical protein
MIKGDKPQNPKNKPQMKIIPYVQVINNLMHNNVNT